MIKIQGWLDIGNDENGGVEGLFKFVFGFLNLVNGKAMH